MVAQATPTTEQDLAAALAQAQGDQQRAESEYQEATLDYQRLSGLTTPEARDAARQRRTEAGTILRIAGERLASARAALNSHRATQRQQQATSEQPDNREAERRAADEAAFERWQRPVG